MTMIMSYTYVSKWQWQWPWKFWKRPTSWSNHENYHDNVHDNDDDNEHDDAQSQEYDVSSPWRSWPRPWPYPRPWPWVFSWLCPEATHIIVIMNRPCNNDEYSIRNENSLKDDQIGDLVGDVLPGLQHWRYEQAGAPPQLVSQAGTLCTKIKYFLYCSLVMVIPISNKIYRFLESSDVLNLIALIKYVAKCCQKTSFLSKNFAARKKVEAPWIKSL